MSELAALLGVGIDYAYRGVTYKAHRIDLEIEAAMEVFCEDQALAAIERQRPKVSRETYDRLLAAWSAAAADGVTYNFAGEVVQRACNVPGPGMRYLAWLQLNRDQSPQTPKPSRELIDAIFRDPTDGYSALARLYVAMTRANGSEIVPNGEAPAAQTPAGG